MVGGLLEIQLKLVNIVVMVLVEFRDGLAHTQGGKPSRRALEPALFHNLGNCGQDLDRKTKKKDFFSCFLLVFCFSWVCL